MSLCEIMVIRPCQRKEKKKNVKTWLPKHKCTLTNFLYCHQAILYIFWTALNDIINRYGEVKERKEEMQNWKNGWKQRD